DGAGVARPQFDAPKTPQMLAFECVRPRMAWHDAIARRPTPLRPQRHCLGTERDASRQQGQSHGDPRGSGMKSRDNHDASILSLTVSIGPLEEPLNGERVNCSRK